MIAIVDYGVNNLASVRNALAAAGGDITVTADPDAIRSAHGVVLPGIGAASAGMAQLRARGLDTVVREVASAGTPFLAICLGMQLLFERSEEGGDVPCLGILPGTVRMLSAPLKIPEIGWNQVETRPDLALWSGMPSSPYFYFVHSYVCDPADTALTAGSTDYGGPFCSAVASGSIWGTQFHPERSGRVGLQLLHNFVNACTGAAPVVHNR